MRSPLRRPFLGAAACAVLLAACASLPQLSYVDERALTPARAPEIAGARGALPDAKKQALLDSIDARIGPTDILARHAAAEEEIAGAPLIAGNKVTLLDDGPETMRAMLAAVRGARKHINLETYIVEADEIGNQLAELLLQKAAAGVTVNLIHDSVGTLDTPRDYFDSLRAGGVHLLEYNPVNPLQAKGDWRLNQRDHRKLLVVDGRIAFTGGVNISKVYGKSSFLHGKRRAAVPGNAGDAAWRDTHMQIEGPAVAEFQKMFLDTWQRKGGQPAIPAAPASTAEASAYFPPLKEAGRALVRAIGSTPEREDFAVYRTYVSAFAHADNSIHLTTAYFVPDRQVVQAMTAAARRGVDVKIIFPGFTDVGLLLHAGRSYYDELLAAGIRIYERKSALLHAKTAVIDGVWSTIGSTNIDMRSFLHNDELNAVVLDVDFAQRMEALFERDLQESVEITREAWDKRPLGARLREWAARLFEYWL